MSPNGLVLYYCADPAELNRARLVFVRFGLRIKLISPEQLGAPVGSFAGLKVPDLPPESGEEAPIPVSMMVFSGLRGHILDQVLAALLKAGVPRSVFKAVVTPTNAGWSFRALYAELVQEREAIAQQRKKD